jgi:hypothetical protein
MPRLPRPTRRLGLLTAAVLSAAGPGCTRYAFRQRADNDVTGVITQKNIFPDWQVRNFHVYPDPRARYADPSDPDRPPYPPDDYAARLLSPNPQHPTKLNGTGRYEGVGYLDYLARWDAENRAADPAGPAAPDADRGYDPDPADRPPEKLPAPKPVGPDGVPPPAGVAPAGNVPAPSGVVPAAGVGGGPVVPAGGRQPADVIREGGGLQEPDPQDPAGKGDPGPLPAGPGSPPGGPPVPGDTGPGSVAGGEQETDFLRALVTNERGFRIKMRQAVELGLLNSREFQDRREDLYLAALPVTLERFSFAALGFFTETAALDYAGRLLNRVPRDSAGYGTDAGFTKLFPTGALLAVRLANRTVVDLAGGRPTTSLSNVGLTLAQPFLRGGGYAVTLEPLTSAERNMLYAMRSYARFRKLFYVAIVAGGNITNNPYSFQGLAVNLGRGIGGNLTAPSVGFLPLNLQAAVIANQRRNVAALEAFLQQYRAFEEGGQQSGLQVSQVEQQLVGSRTQLLGTAGGGGGVGGGGGGGGIRGYLDTLDNFKLQLGLPLTVGLDLDQTPLKPIRDQLGRFDDLYAQARALADEARQFDPAAPPAEFRARWRRLLTETPLVRGTQFARDLPGRWEAWQRLTNDELVRRLADLADERRGLLDRRADLQARGRPEPEADTRRVNRLTADLDLGAFERAVRAYEAAAPRKDAGADALRAAAFRDAFNGFYQLVLEGRNERLAGIRREWPRLPAAVVNGVDLLAVPLDDAAATVVQTALTDRLDLMNARGQVVDAWRQIKVQANSLQGVLDVEYNLDSSTPPGGANPLAFSGARTNHNLTFRGELPLVRRAERNSYRAALIGYQRQRRTLQAFEDNIANDVRSDIRQLRTINELYRFQQRLIEIAYFQVDNARELVVQPPAPGAQTDAGSAAALTNQLLNAQQSLIQAQNQLFTIYVNYLVSRMTLYLDLEQMQIDERGEWSNEPGTGRENPGRPEPGPGPGPGRLPPRAGPGG